MHRFGAVVESRVVGVANLSVGRGRRAHVGYVGVAVHDEYQQLGMGTALMEAVVDLADNRLNLSHLELDVMVDNEAALSLYPRFGFKCKGCKFQDVFRGGEFVDTFVLGRLKEAGE